MFRDFGKALSARFAPPPKPAMPAAPPPLVPKDNDSDDSNSFVGQAEPPEEQYDLDDFLPQSAKKSNKKKLIMEPKLEQAPAAAPAPPQKMHNFMKNRISAWFAPINHNPKPKASSSNPRFRGDKPIVSFKEMQSSGEDETINAPELQVPPPPSKSRVGSVPSILESSSNAAHLKGFTLSRKSSSGAPPPIRVSSKQVFDDEEVVEDAPIFSPQSLKFHTEQENQTHVPAKALVEDIEVGERSSFDATMEKVKNDKVDNTQNNPGCSCYSYGCLTIIACFLILFIGAGGFVAADFFLKIYFFEEETLAPTFAPTLSPTFSPTFAPTLNPTPSV